MASELILRRLRRLAADNTSRAWADDIAMVIPRGLSVLPSISVTFQEFAKASGLHLHIGKTVIAPFSPVDLLQFRETLATAVPAWGATQVAFGAKYLGVYVGLDKGTRSWHSPFAKFLSRAQQ